MEEEEIGDVEAAAPAADAGPLHDALGSRQNRVNWIFATGRKRTAHTTATRVT